MNILLLAKMQLQRENQSLNGKENQLKIIDRMVTIRKYMDLQERNKKVAISRYNKVALVK